jgi:hypothetical protein
MLNLDPLSQKEINFDRLKLDPSDGILKITKSKKFKELSYIDVNQHIEESVIWAIKNEFQSNGRTLDKVIRNSIIGKLGEFVIYHFLDRMGYLPAYPDLKIIEKGEKKNDGGYDLKILDRYWINVKTSTGASNTLLLKKDHFDSLGNCVYRKDLKDPPCQYFFLCRINPDIKKIKLENWTDVDYVVSELSQLRFSCDIPGFLTISDFKKIISENITIESGQILAVKDFKFDVDTYYCQAGNLRDIEEIKKHD